MWRPGLRVSDALSLTPPDCATSDEHPVPTVGNGNGGSRGSWLRIPNPGGHQDGAGIGSPQSALPPASRWIHDAAQLAADVGLLPPDWKAADHAVGHGAAQHMLTSLIPTDVVRRWLGHSSIQTTRI
jgi:integrase